MKTAVFIAVATASLASAHRLDEYLQATTVSLEKSHVNVEMRLTPGVAVLPFILAGIDSNGDGIISSSEQQAYAKRVLNDLSLSLDGRLVALRLVSARFPAVEAMKEGLGEMQLEFTADLPGGRLNRTLVLENRHQKAISVYLANCLVPTDPDLRVTAQIRNYEQSRYQLDYSQRVNRSAEWGWIAGLAALLFTRLLALKRNHRQTISLSHLTQP